MAPGAARRVPLRDLPVPLAGGVMARGGVDDPVFP
jgi:hypothetical protein